MAKADNQKLKILKLWEIMKADSDESHPLSTNEIIQLLKDQDFECGRKALYDDLAALEQDGKVIQVQRNTPAWAKLPDEISKSKQNLYYATQGDFNSSEVRMLVDAVESATFITKSITKGLTFKLMGLRSDNESELLKIATIHLDGIKRDTENVFDNIGIINNAIANGKQLTFCYFDTDLNKNKVYRYEKKRYVTNPLGLVLLSGFYYLICYDDIRKTLTKYRIDRMDDVQEENSEISPKDCGKNLQNYIDQNIAFSMFDGKVENVTLYVKNRFYEDIIDNFGVNLPINKVDDAHFTINVKVQLTRVFFAWCAMYSDGVTIISPTEVVQQLVEFVKETLALYPG